MSTVFIGARAIPRPGKVDRAIEIWQSVAEHIRKNEKDRIRLDLYAAQGDDKGEFLVLEEFSSQQAMDDWNSSTFRAETNKKIQEEDLAQSVEIKVYQKVLSTAD